MKLAAGELRLSRAAGARRDQPPKKTAPIPPFDGRPLPPSAPKRATPCPPAVSRAALPTVHPAKRAPTRSRRPGGQAGALFPFLRLCSRLRLPAFNTAALAGAREIGGASRALRGRITLVHSHESAQPPSVSVEGGGTCAEVVSVRAALGAEARAARRGAARTGRAARTGAAVGAAAALDNSGGHGHGVGSGCKGAQVWLGPR